MTDPAADQTFQLVITPALRPLLDKIMSTAGLMLVPIPMLDSEGEPTLDPRYWPGDDLPTYALHPVYPSVSLTVDPE